MRRMNAAALTPQPSPGHNARFPPPARKDRDASCVRPGHTAGAFAPLPAARLQMAAPAAAISVSMIFLHRLAQANLSPHCFGRLFRWTLMLASNTAAPDGAFVAFLRESAFADRVDWEAVARNAHLGEESYSELWEAGILSGGELADAIALFHNLPRVKAEQIQYRADLFEGLSRRFLRDAWIFPFLDGSDLALAVADPTRDEAIRAVRLALAAPAPLRVAAFDELAVFFEQEADRSRTADARSASLPDEESEIGAEENLERLQDLASGAPVVHAVDAMLEAAINLSATDIHIEPAS